MRLSEVEGPASPALVYAAVSGALLTALAFPVCVCVCG
jgi:hypothetical protein